VQVSDYSQCLASRLLRQTPARGEFMVRKASIATRALGMVAKAVIEIC
jgi:hypothetical protein